MPIPVTRTFLPDIDQYQAYLKQVWQTAQLTNNGPLCRDLAARIETYLGTSHLELVANGTLALQLAIKALNLTGEIITTPYSYVATTNAILWEGCEPVFIDVDERTFCINPDLIEAAITEKTSAILATHVYGYPCEVDRIQAIADRYGLKVIYDAAHAFGVKLNGESLLKHGDCSTLSFHATKLFHTAEGGGVVCKSDEVARKVFLMGKFGHLGEDEYLDIGINTKMSELHAAMGLSVLPKVNEIIQARKQCSLWYDELLADTHLQRPIAVKELEYNYAYYPVVFSSHELMLTVRDALLKQEIYPRRYFYPSLNTLPFLREDQRRSCPVSETLAMRVLCLPLYPSLSRQETERIVAYIKLSLPGC